MASRLDSLQSHKKSYAHDNEFCPDLISAVKVNTAENVVLNVGMIISATLPGDFVNEST